MKITFCFHTTEHEFHMGIAFLSSALRPLAVDMNLVIFREIQGKIMDTVEDTVQRILDQKPSIIGFSIMTFNWRKIQQVIAKLRPDFNGLIIVGGYHAILCPNEVLDFPGVDAVCLGDGEQPLIDLVKFFHDQPLHEVPDILGLQFKRGKPATKPWVVRRLTDYPYMDYELFFNERNQPLPERAIGNLYTGIYALAAITARGCPYKCTYCNNASMMDTLGGPKMYLRHYPAATVVDHLKNISAQYAPKFIEFFDEMFIKSSTWIAEFCEKYQREVGLPFSILMRIDLCEDEMIRLLAKSGLKLVFFGLECGDEEYRTRYMNRQMSNQKIMKGVEILRKYSVMLITFNMFGLPFETWENIQSTISLNRMIQPDAVGGLIYQALPNTKLGKLAKDNDLVLPPPENKWDAQSLGLNNPGLPSEYVVEQVEAFHAEFNSKENVEKFFGRLRTGSGQL
jgi:anaerobic magnesium-protoporphyrin IX monomethyl ester cyclase